MKRSAGIVALLAFIVSVGVVSGTASAHSGTLDPGFGTSNGLAEAEAPARTVRTLPVQTVPLGDGSTISAEVFGLDYRSAIVKRGPDGSPDPTFGDGGAVLLPLFRGRSFPASRLAIQGDSVIVVSDSPGGLSLAMTVQRFDAETGEQDASFGNHGTRKLTLDQFAEGEAGNFYANGLDVDSSGRIYVNTFTGPRRDTSLLIQLTGNGDVSESFGLGGAVSVPRGRCFFSDQMIVTKAGVLLYSHDCIRSFDETGKLNFLYRKVANVPGYRNIDSLVEGPDGSTFISISSGDMDDTVRIQKLDTDGSVGPAFGAFGVVPTFPGQPELLLGSLSVDSEGRFLLVGMPDDGPNGGLHDNSQEVVRFTSAGEPDPTFGGDGMIIYVPPVENRDSFPEVTVVTGGTILTGSNQSQGIRSFKTAVKVTDAGTLDESFGTDGLLRFTASVPADDRMFDTLALTGGGTLTAGRSEYNPVFVRYRPNGKLDSSFGEGGRLTLPTDTFGIRDGAQDLAELDNGDFASCINSSKSVRAARITADGDVDDDFGEGGVVRVAGLEECVGVAASGPGILVFGISGGVGDRVGSAYRLKADGTPDRGFGDEGRITVPAKDFNRPAFALTVLPNGSMLAAGDGELSKFGPDGEKVRAFGSNGIVNLPRSPLQAAVEMDTGPRGAIYIAGHTGRRPIAMKLTRKGKAVRSFGSRGVRTFKNHGFKVQTTDMKVQRGGRMVLSATARVRRCNHACTSVRIYRLKTDGSTDRSFGEKGIVTPVFEGGSEVNSLSLSKPGIVVGGFTETSAGRNDALLFRLER